MEIKPVSSYKQLLDNIKPLARSFVLLYKGGSELSECALRNISAIDESGKEIPIFKADVSVVRDIHSEYGVTTVPALLVFEEGKMTNAIKGCHDSKFFKSVFESLVPQSRTGKNGKGKSVTVYSTPTCSWCTTLKAYLRKNGITFRDIDLSRDPQMAEELTRRSGQQGVPQTDIDGQIVVGFDKGRINRLLDIKG